MGDKVITLSLSSGFRCAARTNAGGLRRMLTIVNDSCLHKKQNYSDSSDILETNYTDSSSKHSRVRKGLVLGRVFLVVYFIFSLQNCCTFELFWNPLASISISRHHIFSQFGIVCYFCSAMALRVIVRAQPSRIFLRTSLCSVSRFALAARTYHSSTVACSAGNAVLW